MSTLTCPKCGSDMRSYERNRVHVDQCTGCGGLFLDRGELEALVAAENAWHQPGPPQGPPGQAPAQGQQYAQQPPQQGGWQQPPVHSQQAPYRQTSKVPGYGYGGHNQGYSQGYGHGKRKKSFLDDLFG